MRIYLAGFFDTRARMRPIRDRIWALGHEVVSTWLDEVKHPETMDTETFYKKLALRDLAEIRSADLIIVDTIDETPRGGREVELGFALGRFQGIEIWTVGPMRNVFHRLADEIFDDWDTAFLALGAPEARVVADATYDEAMTEFRERMSWLEQPVYND